MSTIDNLKKLREETGVSYALCKKALVKTKGDVDSAKTLLSRWGADIAKKKSKRSTSEGAVFSYIHHNKKIGVLISLKCETDFVARSKDFISLGSNLALHIASSDPGNTQELLAQEFVKTPDVSIGQLIKNTVLKLGENITIDEFVRFSI